MCRQWFSLRLPLLKHLVLTNTIPSSFSSLVLSAGIRINEWDTILLIASYRASSRNFGADARFTGNDDDNGFWMDFGAMGLLLRVIE